MMEKTTINKNNNTKGIIALALLILATIWTFVVFSKSGANLKMTMNIYNISFIEKIVLMFVGVIVQSILSIIAFVLIKSERKSHITRINTIGFYLSIGIFILIVIQSIMILLT